jgi:hypothetical protein
LLGTHLGFLRIMIQTAVGSGKEMNNLLSVVASFYGPTLLDSELVTLACSKLYLTGGKWRQTIFGIDPNRSLQRT